jgi:DNA polymerase III subunit beta
MNIKVDRDLFLSELYYLQGVAGVKQLIPILSHLLIEAVPGKITIRATDLDVMVTTECEAVVREGGSICLPARKLAEIVKSLAHGEKENIYVRFTDQRSDQSGALATRDQASFHRRCQ